MPELACRPESPAAFKQAITEMLGSLGVTPNSIVVEGENYPDIQKLALDLSGTRLSRPKSLHSPLTTPEPHPSPIPVRDAHLTAHPLFYESLPIQVDLHATGAKLHPTRLVPQSAEAAHAILSVQHTDLSEYLRAFAVAEAAKQGIQISATRLELDTPTPDSLKFTVHVTAKMFVMSATITLSGTLRIDQQLVVHFSDLHCGGDGMIGSAANALLAPKLQALGKRTLSLRALNPGNLECTQVQLQSGDKLTLKADFAAKA